MLYEVKVFNCGSLIKSHKIEASSSSEAADAIEARYYGGPPTVSTFKNEKGEIKQVVSKWHGCCFESRELPVTAAARLFTAYDQILVEGRSVSASTFLAGLKRGSVNPAGYFIDTLQVTRDEFQWRLEQV